jgi:branched-chain amino acid transport system ATP-binding protein
VTLLEVRDLRGGYGPVRVLQGLDFTVDDGEIVVLLGANGAGKTTTLRALSGLIAAQGSVRYDGADLLGRRAEAVARRGIGHVPEGRGTMAELSVEENLRVGAYLRRDREVTSDLDRWYTVFPRLKERRDQPAGTLSGGEQQMLAIARALMGRPRLLLLDEPSMGLAPIITQSLFRTLAELNAELGVAMLVVEQNAMLALGIARRAYVLETGRIVTSGAAAELREDESVRKAYLGL